jgi:hypothetical protein
MFFYLKTLTIKNSLQIEASKTIKDIFKIRHMPHEMLNQISSQQITLKNQAKQQTTANLALIEKQNIG